MQQRSLSFGIIIFVIIFDQWTKLIVLASETLLRGEEITLLPGFFRIIYVTNTGAAWGMFRGNNTILAVLSVVVFIFMILFHHSLTLGFWERNIAISFILGGIGGNVIDRIVRMEVVDFLSFSFHSLQWPVFNIADSSICTGVVLFFVSSFFRPEKAETVPQDIVNHNR